MKKNPKLDLEKRRPTFLMIGFMASLALTLVAFKWTSFSHQKDSSYVGMDEGMIVEVIEPHRIKEHTEVKTKKRHEVYSPMVKVVDKPVDKLAKTEFTLNPDDMQFDTGSAEDWGLPDDGDDVIYHPWELQHKPHYLDCENLTDEEAQRICTETKVIAMVQDLAKFPRNSGGIDEMVYVKFVVDETGAITDVQAVEGRGSVHFQRAAVKAVEQLPPMVPGQQLGKKVRVQYLIPVRFRFR